MIEVQIIIAALVTLMIFGMSFIWIKPEHMEGRAAATRIGALIYGLVYGAFIGMVMVPFQMQMMDNGMSGDISSVLSRRLPAVAFLVLLVRSDFSARLPLIGKYLRAYRAANLRRSIESASKRLEKLAALDARTAGA